MTQALSDLILELISPILGWEGAMDQAMEGSVAAAFARALIDLAAAKGADQGALSRSAGIEAADLADPDRRIPLARYRALMLAAKEATGDPALALHFGEAFDITELSIVGLMGQAIGSVSEGLEHLGRFARLAIDVPLEPEAKGQRYVLDREGGRTCIVDMRRNPNLFPELTESSFARMVSGARRLGAAAAWQEIHLTHPAPPYVEEYDRIFGVPVVFDSPRNLVLMAGEAWMAMKTPLPSPYVFEVLKERAEALLRALDATATMRGRVEALLAPVLHKGAVRMPAAAAKLGVSRATLARRLRNEGTTFDAVLEGLRRRLADDYLGRRRLSVAETSYLLGFSEPAAFSRAYRRWTGGSPRSARAPARGGGQQAARG
jgi:AraC-like DNA-binding protein